MSLLAPLAIIAFALAGTVRDGALYLGVTHWTRFVALVLLVIGSALAMQLDAALWVALAFAPGIWWAPWHGDAIRFGETGRMDWPRLWYALGNGAALLALPAVALWALGRNPLVLVLIGLAAFPAAYWLGWWAQRRGWLDPDGKFPATRAGHTLRFALIGIALALT